MASECDAPSLSEFLPLWVHVAVFAFSVAVKDALIAVRELCDVLSLGCIGRHGLYGARQRTRTPNFLRVKEAL